MILSLAGKGGVGKTTIAALLLDELARQNYPGRILALDADPAMTLAMALDVESPPATLADIRDSTPLNAQQIRQLPPGVSPVQFVFDKLKHEGVIASRQIREMNFDLLVMGHPQGLGCYCSVEATRTSSNITVHCVSRHFTSGPSSASSFWAVAKSNH